MSENDEKLTECFAERLCDLMQENKPTSVVFLAI